MWPRSPLPARGSQLGSPGGWLHERGEVDVVGHPAFLEVGTAAGNELGAGFERGLRAVVERARDPGAAVVGDRRVGTGALAHRCRLLVPHEARRFTLRPSCRRAGRAGSSRGHALVCLEGVGGGSPASTDVAQQQLECFRSDRARRDQLNALVDAQLLVDEVQQGGSVDHVACHCPSVGSHQWHGSSGLTRAPARERVTGRLARARRTGPGRERQRRMLECVAGLGHGEVRSW